MKNNLVPQLMKKKFLFLNHAISSLCIAIKFWLYGTNLHISEFVLAFQKGQMFDFTAYDLHLPKFIKTSVDSPFNAVVVVVAPILNELELNPFKFH